jgi:hypothetical protein
VGREDHAPPRGGDRLLEREPLRTLFARQLERRERRVSLVQMDDAGVDAERAQRTHTADPEQGVLGEAGLAVAVVEARADPAVHAAVLQPLRVEQVERHTAYVHPPDLRHHVVVVDRNPDRERLAALAGDERGGQPGGVDGVPGLGLQTGRVEALVIVPLPVHHTHRHEGQRRVRRLLQQVACEGTEPSGIDRQRDVDGALGTQERDRVLGRDGSGRVGAGQLLVDRTRELLGAPDQLAVGRGARQHRRRGALEEQHRALAVGGEAVGVDRAEQVGAVEAPAPAIVVGEPRNALSGPGRRSASCWAARTRSDSPG